MKKVLILTAGFGEGHNSAARNLRDALELIDELRFQSQKEKHELSHLYEAKIKNMGNAGRNGGEYYTPRPRREGEFPADDR